MFAQDKSLRYVTTSFLQKPNIGYWNVKIHKLNILKFIPDWSPSRQGKSLDYEWVSILDVLVFKAPHRPFKQRTRLEGYHIVVRRKCRLYNTSLSLTSFFYAPPSAIYRLLPFQVLLCFATLTFLLSAQGNVVSPLLCVCTNVLFAALI
jgi:hypothetical protein